MKIRKTKGVFIIVFSKNQLNLLSNSYRDALKDEYKEYQNDLNHPFYGLCGIYAPLNLSADEVSLNKLDEDMTPAEYFQYGIEPIRTEMIAHYEQQGASWVVNPSGFKTLTIPPHSEPFKFPKEQSVDFSQDQQRFVLNLLHLFLEKSTLSKEELLMRIGIS